MPRSDDKRTESQEIGLLPIFTFVVWVTWFLVALVGLVEDRQSTPAATQPSEAAPVELLSVDLSNEAEPQPVAGSRQAAAVAAPVVPIDLPGPMPTVAMPGSFPTFRPLISAQHFVSTSPAVRLTFGQGEGRQPAPEYPRAAVLAGEEGTVVASFDVGPDGRVDDAEAAIPSPWPLLNHSVLRTIRHDWRFSPGPPRRYEVSIEFDIHRQ